ncbi:hypothetical protein NA56DRAFT_413764 [Hyaloscypha hepaticicola]|uniref:Uncharacterized protein n=1 Tax=Hyaloscypha hepaticicola TaxID=2082293 RepID=A0A2J6PIG1_9HELO|nr:hypothetical protein NA56DRAFT_413764 [Hyaloscypha hepaticicola]
MQSVWQLAIRPQASLHTDFSNTGAFHPHICCSSLPATQHFHTSHLTVIIIKSRPLLHKSTKITVYQAPETWKLGPACEGNY